MESMTQTMPWYIAGPSIALIMFLLTFLGHSFGVSANLRTACSLIGMGKKVKFFDFNWREQKWNLYFILGALIGGGLSNFDTSMLAAETPSIHTHQISDKSKEKLRDLGFTFEREDLLPKEFLLEELSLGSFLMLLIGGVLIGFGSRYAGGCTSGHAISGLSQLQLPSLIAVIGFFIGGLFMSHILIEPLSQFFL